MNIHCSVIVGFVCFVYFLQCNCEETDCSNVVKSPTMALKKKLFCAYDPTVRPVKVHSTTTNVSAYLWFKSIVFHEHYNELDVHCWMVWKWVDEYLTWDKSENSGIEDLHILSSEIWVPDASLYTTADMNSVTTTLPETRCKLEHDGLVTCISPTLMGAICVPDITRWPFDTHNCSMRVGSWSYSAELMNISTEADGIELEESKNYFNRDWQLLSANASRQSIVFENRTYVWITYSFELERHPGGHIATVVAPAIVLAIVTVVTFWLDPVRSHRMGLICVNITCHCLYLMLLSFMLPGNGASTPIIVTFFRDSLLLTGISLVVSICAGLMNTTARAPPTWITSITDFVLSFSLGQIILLGETDPKAVAASLGTGGEDDNTQLVGSPSRSSGWSIFATLLDRVCFVVYTLTLFCLFAAYIP